MICIDAIWLSSEPLEIGAGTDTALAVQQAFFGQCHAMGIAGWRRAVAKYCRVLASGTIGSRYDCKETDRLGIAIGVVRCLAVGGNAQVFGYALV